MIDTAQKIKFPIKDFFSKCDQISRELRIWSHLLKRILLENFIFEQVLVSSLTDLNIKSASEFDLRDQINWKFTVLVTIEIN